MSPEPLDARLIRRRRRRVILLSVIAALVAYFANIGVPKSRLVDETPAAIATAATLESAWFNDSEAQSFELSFSVPWDDNHSFDVEFENGRRVCEP